VTLVRVARRKLFLAGAVAEPVQADKPPLLGRTDNRRATIMLVV